jgi:hypothetical protein
LNFELRALCLLSRSSTFWATLPTLFAFIIFQTESHIYLQACLDIASPISASHIAGMTGTLCHIQLLVEMESCKLFAQAGLQLRLSWSQPPE